MTVQKKLLEPSSSEFCVVVTKSEKLRVELNLVQRFPCYANEVSQVIAPRRDEEAVQMG